MMTLALVVGLGGGLGAVLFRWLITACERFFFGTLGGWFAFLGKSDLLLVPALGGSFSGR